MGQEALTNSELQARVTKAYLVLSVPRIAFVLYRPFLGRDREVRETQPKTPQNTIPVLPSLRHISTIFAGTYTVVPNSRQE